MAAIYIEFAHFGDFDSFDIFRSATSMDVNALPAPIATNLKTMYYADGAVVEGATYYYIVRVNRGSESRLSDEISTTAVYGDEHWANVVSLVHFDSLELDGSIKTPTTLKWMLSGNAALSESDYKFGSSSLYSPAGIDSHAVSELSDSFSFDSSDKITVEFFFRKKNTSGNACLLAVLSSDNSSRWSFFCRAGSAMKLAVYDGSSSFLDANSGIDIDTWVHYAYVKDGTTNRLFANGVLLQTTTRATQGFESSRFFIGHNGLNAEFYVGYVDEVRITKGVARYRENFIPPDIPFLDR